MLFVGRQKPLQDRSRAVVYLSAEELRAVHDLAERYATSRSEMLARLLRTVITGKEQE